MPTFYIDSGSITGSLFGTASWASTAINFVSASNYVQNTQTSSFVTNSQTSSFITNSQTSSFALISQTGSFATTGSNTFNGNQIISGSGTAGILQVVTGSTSLLYVSASGNVGIGTATPSYTLDVNGTSRALTYLHSQQLIGYVNGAPTSTYTYKNTNAGGNNTPQAAFGDFRTAISGLNTFAFRDSEGLVFNTTNTTSTPISRAAIRLASQTNTAGSETGDLIFLTQTGGTAMAENMRITAVGNVTMTQNLSVATTIKAGSGTAVAGNGTYRLTNGASNLTAQSLFGYPDSSAAGFLSIGTDTVNGNGLFFVGPNGVVNNRIARASINITNLVDTASSESADLIFSTKPGSPANTAMTERMRISSTGNVSIGKSSANATLDVTGSAVITGSLTVTVGSTTVGSLTTGNITVGSANSMTFAGGSNSQRLFIGSAITYRNGQSTTLYPEVLMAFNGPSAGNYGFAFDNNYASGLGFVISAGNLTNQVARASLSLKNLNNTVGAEAGDLAFSTVTGGSVLTERMRITGTGNVLISGSTAIDNGFRLDVQAPGPSGSLRVSGSTVLTGSLTTAGDLIITGSAVIGATSLGPSENTLTLGARDAVNEGGQIGFNPPGGSYLSSSFIDNWQNQFRILKGTFTAPFTSSTQYLGLNLGTGQLTLNSYTSATSFTGTPVAGLAVDSSGNIITTGDWTDWSNSANFTGWASFTTRLAQYKRIDTKTMILQVFVEGTGSAGAGASMTLPFTSSAWGTQVFTNKVVNSGATAVAASQTLASSTTLTFYATVGNGSWSSNLARNVYGTFVINIA